MEGRCGRQAGQSNMTHKRHSLCWIVAPHNGRRPHFADRVFLF
jgi:hypothetical protein